MNIKNKYDIAFIKKYGELFEALETDEDDLENICGGYYQYKKWFFLLLEEWFNEIKGNKEINLPYADLFFKLDEMFTELSDLDIARIIYYGLGEDILVRVIEEISIMEEE